uniref:Secreted protein n=1 Tax=Caenorhabditis tropicalis TaxID=1561998 RepID=A0A1I7U2M7_9PELO
MMFLKFFSPIIRCPFSYPLDSSTRPRTISLSMECVHRKKGYLFAFFFFFYNRISKEGKSVKALSSSEKEEAERGGGLTPEDTTPFSGEVIRDTHLS